jgi:hypothetical protein
MSIRTQLQALPETLPLSAPKQEVGPLPNMLASNPAAAMAMMNPMMAIPFMLMAQQAAAMGALGHNSTAAAGAESRLPKAPMVLGGPPAEDSYSGRPSSGNHSGGGRGSHRGGRGRR